MDKENNIDGMKGSYLGPEFSNSEIEKQLNESGAKFKKYSSKKIIELTCDALQKGQAIGWMQGRMEFGPRALGSRSIIADPRSPNMQKRLNLNTARVSVHLLQAFFMAKKKNGSIVKAITPICYLSPI